MMQAQSSSVQLRAPSSRALVARRSAAPSAGRQSLTCVAAAVTPKKILMMGGTRFIGVYLARQLVEAGHEVTLFTRGKTPVTSQIPDDTPASYERYKSAIRHVKANRGDADAVKAALAGHTFDAVYDLNGREAVDTELLLAGLPGGVGQYIYCSSAGVYLKSDTMPHVEGDAVDPKSRHKGKLETESLLQARGVNYTSVRPVYIYGPLNYNPVEEFFFHRIKAGRPICVPGSGLQITQLGHVADLADAFVKILGNPVAKGQTYNIAGDKYVTFAGIAKACAVAAGAPAPELVYFNEKDFDFGKSKAFPMRNQHFFASVEKAKKELGWTPKFDLATGLKDSYDKDFGRGTFREAADFTADDMVLAAKRK